ncbi:MAG: hypothetical protein N5P05_000643 [Chroococcopsis gigantea SAG 12.99]|jgi:predicted RecB family nuclease|nr:TM0106 family RecB-like putative nuclease [Chlorogloea purpurea SAG 13.99]MDV2999037.1 hypothetical protein [Chroococcopsis gigantea SAG 12.99]
MLLTDDLLLDYKRCQRRAFLNAYGSPLQKDPERDFLLKLRQESQQHLKNVLNEHYPDHEEPQARQKHWRTVAEATENLMKEGAACIYHGVLVYEYADHDDAVGTLRARTITLLGRPDLLIKQPGESKYGDWQYWAINIQLGRRPKPEYKLITAFNAYLLGFIQGQLPPYSEIILRRHNYHRVDLSVWIPKMEEVLAECLKMLDYQTEPEVFISRQRCSLCHWYSHCYEIAQSQQHLSLVPGVTPSRYQYLQSVGVLSLESLAAISPKQFGEAMGLEIANQLQQQALSLVENRAFRRAITGKKSVASIPTDDIEFYFDIEAEPEQNLDYLLGVLLVDRTENSQRFYPLLAEKPEDEFRVWEEFLELVHTYPESPIFHFAEYEQETIKRLGQLYQTPRPVIDRLTARCFDLHHQVTQCATLPVESYSLKSLANWIGFQWRNQGVSGDQCVWWYDRWLKTGDRSFLQAIVQYNEDDCKATYHLKNWLADFLS